jgi:hypothetical protein
MLPFLGGNNADQFRWRCRHGVSTEVEAGIDGRLISQQVNSEVAFGRPFVCGSRINLQRRHSD